MNISDGVPYGVYLVCPLEQCDWKLRVDDSVSPVRYVVREWTPEGISAAVNEVAQKRAQDQEDAIRQHLATHDPLDYLRTIASLRQRLGQYEQVPDMVESHWPRRRQ